MELQRGTYVISLVFFLVIAVSFISYPSSILSYGKTGNAEYSRQIMVDEGGSGFYSGICGDNYIDFGEACDGSDLGGNDCNDFGYEGGVLGCTPDCLGFNTYWCSSGDYALSFNNAGEHARISGDEIKDITTGEMSVMMRFYGRNDEIQQVLLSQQDGPNFGTGRNWFLLNYDSVICGSNEFISTFLTGVHICSETVAQKRTWYHVAVVYDGVDTSIYVDGEFEGSRPRSPDEGAIGDFILGDKKNFGSEFNGLIDELSLWDRALSPLEVQNYASDPYLVGNELGLVGYWKFDDGSGNSAEDLVYGNNAVLHGSVDWFGVNFCGNGYVDSGEVCDGNIVSCSENGYNGIRECNNQCNGYGTCQVTEFCGDGIKNGNEECDGSDLGGDFSCTDYGYDGGEVSCISQGNPGQCTLNVNSCYDVVSFCDISDYPDIFFAGIDVDIFSPLEGSPDYIGGDKELTSGCVVEALSYPPDFNYADVFIEPFVGGSIATIFETHPTSTLIQTWNTIEGVYDNQYPDCAALVSGVNGDGADVAYYGGTHPSSSVVMCLKDTLFGEGVFGLSFETDVNTYGMNLEIRRYSNA